MKPYFYKVMSMLLVLVINSNIAKSHVSDSNVIPAAQTTAGIDFIENKGQWLTEARYKAQLPGGVMFITDKGFVYNYTYQQDLERAYNKAHDNIGKIITDLDTLRHHAYRVNFVGSNSAAFYKSLQKREYYHNYFIENDKSTWKGNVGLYGKVTRTDIYNRIDLSVYSKEGSLKYDFIVNPGGVPDQITLSFDGVSPQLTSEGHLHIKTSVNEVIEQAPYAYQMIDGKEVSVPCRYRLSGKFLSFEFPGGYDKFHALVIDPVLVFSTYSGCIGDPSYSFVSAYDSTGNMYTGGFYYPSIPPIGAGWPVTLGAFQTASAGNAPMVINKYNASGSSLLYATYFGTSQYPYAMRINAKGELIVFGQVRRAMDSTLEMPVTTNCYDSTRDGYTDLFVVHFNSMGTNLIGSTFIGGSDIEGEYGLYGFDERNTLSLGEILEDSLGNLWVAGTTASNNFPVTANAAQANYGGGFVDGVLFKLTADCSQLLYSSFIGGSSDDLPLGMLFNKAGNIVLCGMTGSYNFPVTPGVMRMSLAGGMDGFITLIEPANGSVLKSSYIGTSARDEVRLLDVDKDNNIYAIGTTKGNYPISTGVYNIPGGDVFIDKIKPDLSMSLLSTRLGNLQSSPNEGFCVSGFKLDNCENVYISGTNADTTLPVTMDAIQGQNNPSLFWLGVLGRNFSNLTYGSYFGPSDRAHGALHRHPGQHRFDPNGIVYHSLCTNSQLFPTTLGSYSRVHQTSLVDIVGIKIDFRQYTTIDTIVSRYSVIVCFRDSVYLLPNDQNGIDYVWNDSARDKGLWVKQSGVYKVSYQKENILCNVFVDSFEVSILPLPVLLIDSPQSCHGAMRGHVSVNVSENSQIRYLYTWYDGEGNIMQADQSDTGSVMAHLNPGNYKLNIKSGLRCDTTIDFVIGALPVPDAAFSIDSILCIDEKFRIENTTSGDFLSWSWYFGDDASVTAFNPEYVYNKLGTYNVILVVTNEYCSDTFSRKLMVKDFKLELISDNTIADRNSTIILHTNAIDPYTVYQWDPQWLFSDQGAYAQSLKVDSTRSYIVWGKSLYGCVDSAVLDVFMNPQLQMPTVFSPNNDGTNDYFRPVNVGGTITKVSSFRIYDRWGKMLWESAEGEGIQGWDGTYKGTPAELGTYYYSISIETTSGKTTLFKGDVTLVR